MRSATLLHLLFALPFLLAFSVPESRNTGSVETVCLLRSTLVPQPCPENGPNPTWWGACDGKTCAANTCSVAWNVVDPERPPCAQCTDQTEGAKPCGWKANLNVPCRCTANPHPFEGACLADRSCCP